VGPAGDWTRWLATARDWVLAVERAYVEAAVGRPAAAPSGPPAGAATHVASEHAELTALAAAAAGAVASRFLAVGTPRSIGLIGGRMESALSLAAHRVWFRPTDLRCAGSDDTSADAAAIAAELGGRAASLDEALAADIVCIHVPLALSATRLRRGTHVNALAAGIELDEELRTLATIADEPDGLPALAAGLRDGRQLDELTVFVGGALAIARARLAATSS
jgi:hypothetical protein